MTRALTHRGPDGEGIWKESGEPLYLGHRRLAIVDLSGGDQPMLSHDERYVITFNGEIYNHRDLRLELEDRGHRFRTSHSDTEMLLEGYREWGSQLQERLNGMWAFVLYDRKERRLFGSRDRFGEKPFFYCRSAMRFAFASELGSLTRHSLIGPGVSELSLAKYFAYGYIPAPGTIYEGIAKLPAGHCFYLDVRDMNLRVEAYWDPESVCSRQIRHAPEAAREELERHLTRSVRERLQADVPVGIFLSGGVDSSLITGAAAVGSGQTVKTYTVGFEEDFFNESEYARQVASYFGTEHQSEILHLNKGREMMAPVLARMDEPMGDSSLIPSFLVCQSASRQVKVVLGGDGADELFSGYNTFKMIPFLDLYGKVVPRRFKKMIAECLDLLLRGVDVDRIGSKELLRRVLRSTRYSEAAWLPFWLGPSLDLDNLQKLLGTSYAFEEIYDEAIRYRLRTRGWSGMQALTYMYLKLYLQDDILVKVDRASMMNGLEVRSPFLDYPLADFALSMDVSLKHKSYTGKFLLKEAIKRKVPGFSSRRSKQGFRMPVGQWLGEGTINVMDRVFSGLNHSFIESRLFDHIHGVSNERNFLWNVYALNEWTPSGET